MTVVEKHSIYNNLTILFIYFGVGKLRLGFLCTCIS